MRTEEDRFWSKVDCSEGPSGCWPWTGRIDRDGYGQFDAFGTTIGAHRFACALAHGDPAWPDARACHEPVCETRRCCNPEHLRWDSQGGNQADVAIIGSRRGVKHPRAALTEDQVRQIWFRRADGPTRISRELNVSRAAVKHIVRGSNWTHITGAAVAS